MAALEEQRPSRVRRRTATSNFGVGARENHDASGFYARFRPPILSDDDAVLAPAPIAEPFQVGDARDMSAVTSGSVALVVTSPPYFAGKQYEEELERDGVPSSYLEYLGLLRDVFAECVRTLEPGGRLAVNVANLGRKPYRSLSADVIGILEDDLGLLLRGEIVWQKGEGANGSCAWGSYRRAANPVLRDITERVVVASKGRFDRARSAAQRRRDGLPHESTIATDDFLSLTLDVWSMPTESAKRVGHPAPFPVELPAQLIRLYTYRDDLVLDPFLGSGSTLVAAAQLGRRYVGYDLDADYVELARQRVGAALAATPSEQAIAEAATGAETDGVTMAKAAEALVEAAGFTIVARQQRVRGAGVVASLMARDASGRQWCVEPAGSHGAHRPGLTRADALWRTLGRVAVLRAALDPDVPIVVVTSRRPAPGGEGDQALRALMPHTVHDVVELDDADGLARLRAAGAAR